ncbi:hypothetical protein RF11_12673 [Thelohanellus kitauei]|uniref:Uncharacterized protein n=1 Tax=Thelohanellus kitauei TaxID=669202 RepID=A0A0C2JAJ5_THEKT|nr:hypothetical protein RF11_12673 [Thelohanellus kitauei]
MKKKQVVVEIYLSSINYIAEQSNLLKVFKIHNAVYPKDVPNTRGRFSYSRHPMLGIDYLILEAKLDSKPIIATTQEVQAHIVLLVAILQKRHKEHGMVVLHLYIYVATFEKKFLHESLLPELNGEFGMLNGRNQLKEYIFRYACKYSPSMLSEDDTAFDW